MLHSSTNTKRLASILSATEALQGALRNSSRSLPAIFSRLNPRRLSIRKTVESLTFGLDPGRRTHQSSRQRPFGLSAPQTSRLPDSPRAWRLG